MEPAATQATLAENPMAENGLLENELLVKMTALEAQQDFAATLSRVTTAGKRVILSQDGKEVAAVISIEDFRWLEQRIEDLEDQVDLEEAQRILVETAPEDYISYDQVRKELQLD